MSQDRRNSGEPDRAARCSRSETTPARALQLAEGSPPLCRWRSLRSALIGEVGGPARQEGVVCTIRSSTERFIYPVARARAPGSVNRFGLDDGRVATRPGGWRLMPPSGGAEAGEQRRRSKGSNRQVFVGGRPEEGGSR